MENNQLQLAPQQVSKELVKSMFNKHLGLRNYIKIVQAAQSLTFTKDNLSADYPALKELNSLVKELSDLKKEIKDPYTEAGKNIEIVFKEITEPLSAILEQKKSELKVANEAALKEKQAAEQENARRNAIVAQISTFINHVTKDVALADSDTEITRIQKLIGSEKARKGYYQEYHEEFLDKCSALDEPIREKKEFIRQKTANEAKLEQAIRDGDMTKAAELKDKQEILEQQTLESSIVLQEKAFEQNLAIQEVIPETIIETIKPRRTMWKWRVDDIQQLQKKMPDLVKLVPNDEAIEVLFAAKKAEKVLINGQDYHLFGLTFYQEKFY